MRGKPTDEELQALMCSALTIPLWPHAGSALRLSKNSAYEAAKKGEIPTIRIGGAIRVPTAPLRKMLGMETASAATVTGQAA